MGSASPQSASGPGDNAQVSSLMSRSWARRVGRDWVRGSETRGAAKSIGRTEH